MAWTDRDGHPVEVPEPPPSGSHYAAIGDFQGACYERNAFARGTAQEASALAVVLRLSPGMRMVDAGCGTGRHARELAGRGVEVIGADLSAGLLAHAQRLLPGRWVRADARALPLPDASVDAAASVCQGAFSIGRESDRLVLAELARVARPGARIAATAYSLPFAARFLAPGDAIDIGRGLVHTRAEVRGPDGHERTFDLWTQCYTPTEFATAATGAGLRVEDIASVEPGRYGRSGLNIAAPELLGVFSKP